MTLPRTLAESRSACTGQATESGDGGAVRVASQARMGSIMFRREFGLRRGRRRNLLARLTQPG